MSREPSRSPGPRRRLLVRLLAGSILVAVCSITATAWLAAQTTSGVIHQAQGRALADDTHIYDALLGYAARHPDWKGVGSTIRDLAGETGRRIRLTTEDRRPITGSVTGDDPLPERASGAVDPLNIDPGLVRSDSTDRIDPRASGPFLLPPAERDRLASVAGRQVACLTDSGVAAEVLTGPTGRPRVQPLNRSVTPPSGCAAPELDRPTATEAKALRRLGALVNSCLGRMDLPKITLGLDLSWTWTEPAATHQSLDRKIDACIGNSRRELLGPYVAPAALLFIDGPAGSPAPGFELSPANVTRIAGVAGIVLVLAIGVTALIAARLTRPIRALTDAAHRMREGDPTARVEVTGRDEIGELAAAFNEMSEHRERLEAQRKAMVSDVAHELRNPLSNIRGWLEAAEDGVAELDRELMSRLLKEAVLLQHIVDDLRDLSAADAGRLRLHPEPLYLRDLLDQVAVAPRNHGVALTVDVTGDPELTADPVRLRQVIGNLVGNALRHTPPGGRVTLLGHRDGDEAVIEVRDTGAGIAPEDLPHVFDRFWRAEKSRNRQSGGSGLGLAIVRSIVTAHGGTVTATSTPGAGTAFTLRLPVEGPLPTSSMPCS